ncbi:tRNA glutamyl-Q(34) synthetase GluQRS [Solimonas marina]|uniref:Glutamyl-Q tRNA(Asp) synthetase n=1 Tax=Solimonas marina TaxID=2714601 RepID=A0A969W953_9GAMM|nr:tRNA glutamyl-Q(34) synthetase GluQRS [Solimonas marina]NKF22647.1 tRNA glutamyl-Q(34) synthetase GluQRS [Solimonas marina]
MTDTARPSASGPYRGRFAPTPSGPLHLGSLLAALASYLDARHHGGQWLLRIDDLDRPRCPPGADQRILRQLEAHGLDWDDTPHYQSRHLDDYHHCLVALQNTGQIYACDCTRATLACESHSGTDGPVYSGRCRERRLAADGRALRRRIGFGSVVLDDDIQGPQQRDLQADIGDIVVRRRDGIIGYQLASSVDDHLMRISDVVRGADLTGSSATQHELISGLGWTPPRYRHVPLLTDADGLKLSKQNHAPAIEDDQAAANLWRCLTWLAQQPPTELRAAAPREQLAWAIPNWRRARVAAAAQQSMTLTA